MSSQTDMFSCSLTPTIKFSVRLCPFIIFFLILLKRSRQMKAESAVFQCVRCNDESSPGVEDETDL